MLRLRQSPKRPMSIPYHGINNHHTLETSIMREKSKTQFFGILQLWFQMPTADSMESVDTSPLMLHPQHCMKLDSTMCSVERTAMASEMLSTSKVMEVLGFMLEHS